MADALFNENYFVENPPKTEESKLKISDGVISDFH